MSISVIVPTYNEEKNIEVFLQQLLQHKFNEIIIVDGGSSDQTRQLAKKHTDKIYISSKGRAAQMNFGASRAQGTVFLFLHADTFLPSDAKQEILNGITISKCGKFRDSFEPSNTCLRFYAFFTRFQYFSYGDQAFFMHRQCFDSINGFDENHPFEDIDFYKRLRKIHKPYISLKSVRTSSRRFIKVGVIKQAMIDFLFILMIEFSIPHKHIKKVKKYLYSDIR
ncbi:TIGR04283 family arsenosugar biosynthesis glycosyltransferase [Candidatus Uabimicrobium sp. HlEnr_7]|uniref:TIGR04283 family arsenosugar biosynthesis glycosyltransferase n=1 Tax=Candidatus Uabimicrobium helgolandensis TaxID=3095367 RepID=UPI0035591030